VNPYQSLPREAFWRTAVAEAAETGITGLWQPKITIDAQTPVATFGSCFAQHIGAALRQRRFAWLETEPAPTGMSEESATAFNYGLFTCRTGNIYTTSLLRQWVSWALGESAPPDLVWQSDGRFYVPFRPRIEPDGFQSAEEARLSRQAAIEALRKALERARCLVFTLGLTESWIDGPGGFEYPLCPGTAAGTFDAARHHFVNQSYETVRDNLAAAIAMMRGLNADLDILLTVSPVPLTATNSGQHVLVATNHSKAVLRAVAGACAESAARVDYFPSYELITSPVFGGRFFADNLRSVTPEGVTFVMNAFFAALGEPVEEMAPAEGDRRRRARARKQADVVCEEEILEAFSR